LFRGAAFGEIPKSPDRKCIANAKRGPDRGSRMRPLLSVTYGGWLQCGMAPIGLETGLSPQARASFPSEWPSRTSCHLNWSEAQPSALRVCAISCGADIRARGALAIFISTAPTPLDTIPTLRTCIQYPGRISNSYTPPAPPPE